MELRTLHIDTAQLVTKVRATHPERVVDGMLGPEATARILDGGKALLTWLWQTGRLPDGELFTSGAFGFWETGWRLSVAGRWHTRGTVSPPLDAS